MPSITEATRASRGRARRRLIAGVGLLLTGALLVGIGAVGATRPGSFRNGILVGGLAILAALVVLADRATLAEHERTVAAIGAAFGLAGLLLFWAVVSGPDPFVIVGPAIFAAVLYAAGVVVIGAAVLSAASMGSDRQQRPTLNVAPRERSSDGRGSRETAADGGATEDDLTFPLDDD